MPVINEFNDSVPKAYQLTEGQSFRLNNFMWEWFYTHINDVIVTIRVPIVGIKLVTVKVKDVKFLFELIFGEPVTKEL